MRVVLVHGTTQSPAGWDLVRTELEQAGHEVIAVDLAGVDPQAPAITYGAAAADQVPGRRCDVVVAHSGSGLLLPTIAAATAANVQVYLAAVIPHGVLSFQADVDLDPAAVADERWVGVDPTVDPDAARQFLFHDCDEQRAAWAQTTLRRFVPVAVYDEILTVGAIISKVIVPTNDRTLRRSWMLIAARERLGIEPVLIDAGHCPHVSQPQTFAHLIRGSAS